MGSPNIVETSLPKTVLKFRHYLSTFECDSIPRILFTRAILPKTSWGPTGELFTSPCTELLPQWLLRVIEEAGYPSGAFQQALDTLTLSKENDDGRSLTAYCLSAKLGWIFRGGLSSIDVEGFLFDLLSTVLQVFPDAYTEILWEETEAQLWEIVESTCLPFLAVLDISDIMRYLSSSSQLVYLNQTQSDASPNNGVEYLSQKYLILEHFQNSCCESAQFLEKRVRHRSRLFC
jgi:hypothetical protein